MRALHKVHIALLTAANGFISVADGFQFPDCARGPLANTTVCDIKATPSDRAAALVRLMNTTEKLNNLVE